MSVATQSIHGALAPIQLRREDAKRLLTPALAIYPQIVDSNIVATLRLLGDQPTRWRLHVKTAKLDAVMRRFVNHGIRQFKCATTLELLTVCQAGAEDVLVAYPSVGPRVKRIQEIAAQFPKVRISVLVENKKQIDAWNKDKVGIFIDVNPGMDRTGISELLTSDIVALAHEIKGGERRFAGLHYYDGHYRELGPERRKLAAYAGYNRLLAIIQALQEMNIEVPEVVTSGTPTFHFALAFPGFKRTEFRHTVSPGTLVYNDLTSLSHLDPGWGYAPGALVITTVVSHPTLGVITCDAGYKSVSADSGFPNCSVWGHAELEPLRPSEEHMSIRVPEGKVVPNIGEILYLVPKHICPTVNNFDHALLLENGKVVDVVPVSARGREAPFLSASGTV